MEQTKSAKSKYVFFSDISSTVPTIFIILFLFWGDFIFKEYKSLVEQGREIVFIFFLTKAFCKTFIFFSSKIVPLVKIIFPLLSYMFSARICSLACFQMSIF